MFKTASKYERRGLGLRARPLVLLASVLWDVDGFWCRNQHPNRTEPLRRWSSHPAQPAGRVSWFLQGETAY